jgi:hypothetical protein
MSTLDHNDTPEVEIRNIYFQDDLLFVELSDERQIGLPFKKIKWSDWLAKATPEQRSNWSIEPYGYAVWWAELDDGFELEHILSLKPLPHKQPHSAVKPVLATA